jgi:hypothetical protein
MTPLTAILVASNVEQAGETCHRLHRHGIPWNLYTGGWRGYGMKIHKALEASRTVDSEHLLVMDAYDVLVLAGTDEILAQFERFAHPWVCCAENNIWPDADKAALYPPAPTQWRYLNSGAFIAETRYLRTMLEAWRADLVAVTEDDQRWYTGQFLSHPGAIVLDTGCRLFQSMLANTAAERAKLLDMNQERTVCRNLVTGAEPLILHFNGTGLHDEHFFGERKP